MITRRRADGTVKCYQARYASPVDRGVRVQRQFPPGMEADARRWLEEEHYLVLMHLKGIAEWVHPRQREARLAASRMTLREFVETDFVPNYRKRDGGRLKPAAYRNLVCDCSHFLDAMGDMKACRISSADIRRWMDAPHDEGPWAFHRSCRRLKTVFACMCRDVNGRPPIRDDNPFIFPVPRRPPDSKRLTVPPVTPVEARIMADAMPERLRLAIWLPVLVGGLRIGETCALQRQDINLQTRTLTVLHSTVRGDGDVGRTVVGDTKTASSRRIVSIPAMLVPLIRDHLDRFCDTRRDAQVFPASRDDRAPLCPNTLRYHFGKARKAAGREDLTFQSLRASHATLLVLKGATMREAMDQLGHSSLEVALRHYQRVVPDHLRRIVEVLAFEFIPEAVDPEQLDCIIQDTVGQLEKLEKTLAELETLRKRLCSA